MEIERKYLIKDLPDLKEYIKEEIEQFYLSIEPEVRVRKKGNKYTLTIKSSGKLIRKEVEKELSKEDYEALKEMAIKKILKTRYSKINIIEGNEYLFEIDIYKSIERLVTIEVEFESEREAYKFNFIKPEWFGLELTDIDKYKNKNLARDV